MKTLNPKILMTMKYLEYPKSVSLDGLKRNMDAAEAHDHINEYFKFSCENKQDYLDELERTK